MSKYIIVADSNIDLPDSLAKELELDVIAMKFNIQGKEYTGYLDEREFRLSKFYNLLRNKQLATTVQINPAEFEETFRRILESGKDVLYIAFSSALSGTYNSSLIAKKELEKEFPDRRIECFDSKCASNGEGLMVTYAAKMRQAGKSLDDVLHFLENEQQSFIHLFTVADLGHLRRGGRLSPSSAILGTLLSIKPVLHVSPEGQLKAIGKARGRAKAIKTMVDRMVETYNKEINDFIYIGHGDCYEDALKAKDLIMKALNVPEEMFMIHYIGPSIGAHSGVNTLALYYRGSERHLDN